MRPHQWLKNALVALPVLAAHDFSIATVTAAIIAFASFCLGASGIYLINDMVDLPNDRIHREKRNRPLASGIVPLAHPLVLAGFLIAFSIAFAFFLPWLFLVVLTGYFGLTTFYSFYLKRKLMIDVSLAALYGMRVLAGVAATAVVLSDRLVGFCFFVFLSLALVKRGAEMIAEPETNIENIKGRGYRRADMPIVNALARSSGFIAVLVLSLYINSPDVKQLYARPYLLWIICIVSVYWLVRLRRLIASAS